MAERWNTLCYEEFYAEGDVDRSKSRKLNPLHDIICGLQIMCNNIVVSSPLGSNHNHAHKERKTQSLLLSRSATNRMCLKAH